MQLFSACNCGALIFFFFWRHVEFLVGEVNRMKFEGKFSGCWSVDFPSFFNIGLLRILCFEFVER